jgi:hypothetical protein
MRGRLSQLVIAMLQFGLILEVRGVGDGASWPSNGKINRGVTYH